MRTSFITVVLVIGALAAIAALTSCGTGTAILFSPDGIQVIPPTDVITIPGTEATPTK